MQQPTKGQPQPAQPAKPPPSPHTGEGADSALEALKNVRRGKPNARERDPETGAPRK